MGRSIGLVQRPSNTWPSTTVAVYWKGVSWSLGFGMVVCTYVRAYNSPWVVDYDQTKGLRRTASMTWCVTWCVGSKDDVRKIQLDSAGLSQLTLCCVEKPQEIHHISHKTQTTRSMVAPLDAKGPAKRQHISFNLQPDQYELQS